MNCSASTAKNPSISEEIQASWQRIVDLIAKILGVPAALINRVDPPQLEVLVASATANNPFRKGDRVDLLGLYCETVMKTRAPLLVPDALKDPEWDHNPDIKLGMTFYLGYPLTWPNGELFGTICLLDVKDNPQCATQFRELIAEFQQMVEKDLRLLVETHERKELLAELQEHRDHLQKMVTEKIAELANKERVLSEVQRVAHVGSWEWDIKGGTQHWSDELYRIFGMRPQEMEATDEAFLAFVHPDDRQAVDRANQESITEPDTLYSIEYRVVRPDGTERVVDARAEVLFDQNLRPLRMIGTALDVTEHKHQEEELVRALVQVQTLKERLEPENILLDNELKELTGHRDIIGSSNQLKYVRHRIRQVAHTNATVLITGETGSGKGAFARLIHETSDRKDKPFVLVNCAALPANLIESELFGREKGAFTGSTARQIGRFELADGGTIFLDEIGELPFELQAKLLRVLEDGAFERLGSPHPVKVDVRIIASTNRDLLKEFKKGRFRSDLFYRLNVFPISVPPLRERRKDIPALVRFFVNKFGKPYGKDIRQIPNDTMKYLERYDWPGNVRELMNVVERAIITTEGSVLRLADKIDAIPLPHQEETAGVWEPSGFKGLAEVEREHILKILKEKGWKIEGRNGAAQILGINPSTLKARMRKLDIKRPTAN